MSNWYEYDVKSIKALIILMSKAKKPLALKAGHILDLSLNTFTAVSSNCSNVDSGCKNRLATIL